MAKISVAGEKERERTPPALGLPRPLRDSSTSETGIGQGRDSGFGVSSCPCSCAAGGEDERRRQAWGESGFDQGGALQPRGRERSAYVTGKPGARRNPGRRAKNPGARGIVEAWEEATGRRAAHY